MVEASLRISLRLPDSANEIAAITDFPWPGANEWNAPNRKARANPMIQINGFNLWTRIYLLVNRVRVDPVFTDMEADTCGTGRVGEGVIEGLGC